jgi:imidazolonepropionase
VSVGILNARVLTPAGPLARASILTAGTGIASIMEGDAGEDMILRSRPLALVRADGRVLMPAFVDAHTHACWAGDRLDEWDARRRGTSYLDILKAGGGIMSTVRAVRAASVEELTALLLGRLNLMLREGTTTVEVKSGYGLDTATELKMLRAIAAAAADFPGTVVPTALLGHAIDPDFPGGADAFIDYTIRDTLPAVHAAFPGIAIDAYCERGAWNVGQCVRLFSAAKKLGHPFRVHADQFTSLGMAAAGLELGATSIDHLEAGTPADLAAIARSPSTFGVMLPICGLHMDGRYADGRAFLDASPSPAARLAVATNFNPGSAPSGSMPLAIATAVRHNGLTPHEAIAAATTAPARLLGFTDRGAIAPGMRADLIILRHADERMLVYELGLSPIGTVICAGRVIFDGPALQAGPS